MSIDLTKFYTNEEFLTSSRIDEYNLSESDESSINEFSDSGESSDSSEFSVDNDGMWYQIIKQLNIVINLLTIIIYSLHTIIRWNGLCFEII